MIGPRIAKVMTNVLNFAEDASVEDVDRASLAVVVLVLMIQSLACC
jgi:hypothetical protein